MIKIKINLKRDQKKIIFPMINKIGAMRFKINKSKIKIGDKITKIGDKRSQIREKAIKIGDKVIRIGEITKIMIKINIGIKNEVIMIKIFNGVKMIKIKKIKEIMIK